MILNTARLHTRRAARTRAFTLIEVLVVVAIIALLISILLPSLASARELARRTICSAQQGEMGKAMFMYNTGNKEFLPGPLHQALELETVAKVASGDYESFHLLYYVRRYFSDRSRDKKLTDTIARCPTADKITGTKSTWTTTDAARPFTYTLNNWSKKLKTDYFGTNPEQYFGWPGPGSGSTQFWSGTPDGGVRFSLNANAAEVARPKRISTIKQLGREWAIADAFTYPEPLPIAGTGKLPGQWQVGTYQNIDWLISSGIPFAKKPYHDNGVNMVMFDGHAEYQRVWRGTVNPYVP